MFQNLQEMTDNSNKAADAHADRQLQAFNNVNSNIERMVALLEGISNAVGARNSAAAAAAAAEQN